MEESPTTDTSYEGWGIVELMGHRQIAGHLRNVTMYGSDFLRIDVTLPDNTVTVTQFYSPSSVYCITPTTRDTAVHVAIRNQSGPIQALDIPRFEADTEPY